MIKKKANSNTARSRIGSKCETKKKKIIITDISFYFEVYGFLTIHIVTLLKLEIERKAKKI